MRLLIILSCIATGVLAAQASSFCAVTISIRNEDRIPLSIPVELITADGKIAQSLSSDRGEARICDLEFGLYSIVIARGLCGATTLHDVKLVYGKTHHFDVTLNSCPDEEIQRTGCVVYFRVRDTLGTKLAEVTARSSLGVSAKTDEYGRAQLPLGLTKTSEFRFTLTGFDPKEAEAECKQPIELDREIIMQRSGR